MFIRELRNSTNYHFFGDVLFIANMLRIELYSLNLDNL